jgi:hypothetical protein
MEPKRILKIACLALCALILLAVLFNGFGNTQFEIMPKDWRVSVSQLEIETLVKTNGTSESFTNRVSKIGPLIVREFNR